MDRTRILTQMFRESGSAAQPVGQNQEPSSSTGKSPDKEANMTFTTPARVSFGIELEFLIAERPIGMPDPDEAIAHLLPPLYAQAQSRSELIRFLERNGIPLTDEGNPDGGWQVDDDISVTPERGLWLEGDYTWIGVELRSPASFKTEEALAMIPLVINLIKSNFRCRVNTTCGFHVHVGNGFDRIPARQMRKFAALFWAAEPLLSTLHPQERAFNIWARSIRRSRASHLASGRTADDMRQYILGERDEAINEMRYYGRDRKMGEPADPVSIGSGRFRTNPTAILDADDTDWRTDGYAPFKRPRTRNAISLAVPEEWHVNPGRVTMQRRQAKPVGGKARGGENTSRPPPPRHVPFTRQVLPPSDENRTASILAEGVPGRLRALEPDLATGRRPEMSEVWPGVKEIMACDVGSHQVGRLMTPWDCSRGTNMNFSNYASHDMMEAIRVPDSWLSEEGRSMRKRQAKLGNPHKHFTNRYSDPFPEDMACVTVENREAAGTLDGEWVVTWVRILCGLLEYARDADPAGFMRVIGLCSEATDEVGGEKIEYDVVDLLSDIGLWAEAKMAEERLRRGAEAWFQCMILERAESDDGDEWDIIV